VVRHVLERPSVAAPVIQNRRPAIGQQKNNLKHGAAQVPKGGCPELVGSKSSEDGWGKEAASSLLVGLDEITGIGGLVLVLVVS